jgi:hypothetical protein
MAPGASPRGSVILYSTVQYSPSKSRGGGQGGRRSWPPVHVAVAWYVHVQCCTVCMMDALMG